MFLHKNVGIFSQLPILYFKQTTVISTFIFDDSSSYTVLNINADTLKSGTITNNIFTDKSYTLEYSGTHLTLTQGAFSPYSRFGWSCFFDGANSYLSIPSNSSLNFGSSEFTIEFWWNPSSVTNNYDILGKWTSGSTNNEWLLQYRATDISSNKGFRFLINNTTQNDFAYTTLSANVWSHIALTKDSTGAYKLFVNGIQAGSTITNTDNINTTSTNLQIGYISNPYTGYISKLRIIKDYAVYKTNFSVNYDEPIKLLANTSLITFDNPFFLDKSRNNSSITIGNGSPKMTRFSPITLDHDPEIHGGSAYFNGTSYIKTTETESDLGTDPFTIECWVYPTQYYSTNIGAVIISHMVPTGGNETWTLSLGNNNNNENKVSFFDGSSWYQGSTLPLSTWNHIAIVRTSSGGPNNLIMYINGIGVTPRTVTSNYQSLSVSVGVRYNDLANSKFMGYISNLRIIKQAIYTSNFVPPIRRVTETSNGGAIINGTEISSVTGNTLLLLDFNNAGVIDTSIYNRHISIGYNAIGGDNITNVVNSKFGSGCLYFNGATTQKLTIPTDSSLTFGTSNFTIEFWIYRDTTDGVDRNLIDFRTTTRMNLPVIYMKSSFYITYRINITDQKSSTSKIQLNTWTHVACVKNNNTTSIFINGVSEGSFTDNNNYVQPESISIGTGFTGGNPLIGGLEDIRITKGIARYTSNFNPPTKLAANYTDPYFNNVILFINGNNIGGGNNNHFRATKAKRGLSILNGGNPYQGSVSPFYPNGWSTYFNGVSSWISPSTSVSLLTSNTQSFTFETWFYRVNKTVTGASASECIFACSNGFNIRIDSGKLHICKGDPPTNGSPSINGFPIVAIKENVWYHLAVCGTPGTNSKFYLNGVLQGQTNSILGIQNNNNILIGNLQRADSANPDWCFSGFISNLRFVRGVDLYKSNFIPPRQKLKKIEGNGVSTVVLACQDALFLDNGSNNLNFDWQGNASTVVFNPLETTEEYSPEIHGGSLYLNDNSYLQIATNPVFGISSYLDFTIEFFINLVNYTTDNLINVQTPSSNFSLLIHFRNSKVLVSHYNTGSGVTTLESTKTLSLNTWYHIAVTRTNSIRRIFVNGVLDGIDNSPSYITYSSNPFRLGANFATTSTTYSYGYVSNFRYVKGRSLYTSNFKPPTSKLTAVNGTSLLLHFDNANLIDTSNNVNLRAINNPTIDNTISSPLSSSNGVIKFTNTTKDAISIHEGSNPKLLEFRNDFTIECWIYNLSNATTLGKFIFDSRINTTNAPFFVVYFNNENLFYSNSSIRITAPLFSLNEWHHIALSRESNITRLFVDGVLVGSYTETTVSINNTHNRLVFGQNVSLDKDPFNGYMDDIRVINGKAIYTKNFTPTKSRNPIPKNLTYPTDPYKKYVVLDIDCEQSYNEQNLTFLDSSSNKHVPNQISNVPSQGSFSPFNPNGWSGYFHGTSCLSGTYNKQLNFGVNDFTIEFWLNPDNNPSKYGIVSTIQNNLNSGFAVYTDSDVSNNLRIKLNTNDYDSGSSAESNVWSHWVITRSGTTLKWFKNGVLTQTHSNVNEDITNTNIFTIGRANSLNYNYAGYISNLRIVKGQSLYTTDFSPISSKLTTTNTVNNVVLSSENVSLLTLQDNYFKDNSNYSFSITVSGANSGGTNTPTVKSYSPFIPSISYSPSIHGGSCYLSESSYIRYASNDSYNNISGDFTIDFWLYKNNMDSEAYVTSYVNTYALAILNNVIRINADNTLQVLIGNSTTTLNSTTLIFSFQWYHVSIVRKSGVLSLYINGKLENKINNTATITSTGNFHIGAFSNGTAFFNGYISNFRFVKNTAIIPPDGGPQTPTQAIPGTGLLLDFNNIGIMDNSRNYNIITRNTAKVDYSDKKLFGFGSLIFNGTNDYLQVGKANDWKFLHSPNTKWTIEFWIYSNSSTSQTILDTNGSTLGAHGISLQKRTDNTLDLFVSNGTDGSPVIRATTTTTILSSTWTHVAITYDHSLASNNMVIYFNGVLPETFSKTAQTPSTTSPANALSIGCYGIGTGQFFNGSIDELRITNGIIRYNSAFTVSSYSSPISSI